MSIDTYPQDQIIDLTDGESVKSAEGWKPLFKEYQELPPEKLALLEEQELHMYTELLIALENATRARYGALPVAFNRESKQTHSQESEEFSTYDTAMLRFRLAKKEYDDFLGRLGM
ncbi:MAG: hypothetical protein R3B12_01620 [Candidatus Saccharimonadales bacterium]